MVPVAYCRLVAEHPQRFLLLALVAMISFAIDPVVGIILGTVVALLGSAQAASTARGRLSATAKAPASNAADKRGSGPGPPLPMVTIDAGALDVEEVTATLRGQHSRYW